MKEKMRMYRGQLCVMTSAGERITPTPYMREHIVRDTHEELGHIGCGRVVTALKE